MKSEPKHTVTTSSTKQVLTPLHLRITAASVIDVVVVFQGVWDDGVGIVTLWEVSSLLRRANFEFHGSSEAHAIGCCAQEYSVDSLITLWGSHNRKYSPAHRREAFSAVVT